MDLKKDLDEYLLLQNDQKKSTFLQMSSINVLNKWLRRGESANDESSTEKTWFQETKNECCPSLTKFQRFSLFGICICMGILCFVLSLMYVPVLLFKARKFSLLFTLGSLFFISSFFFLWGPIDYLKHMVSRDRIFITLSYGGTLFATLYAALHLQNTPLTVLFAIGQIISLLWTSIVNIPGGPNGLSFMYNLISRTSTRTSNHILPV